MSTTVTAAALGALMLLVACLSDNAKSTEPPAACVKAGDPCTFSPGKLGLCIVPVDGTGSPVCQSQH